jgi:hypothetical protein
MPDEELRIKLKKFKALSAGLTGLSVQQLSPNVDPIGLAELYWNTLQKNLDERLRANLDEMLKEIKPKPEDDQHKPPEPPDKATLGTLLADERFQPLARSILKLWMLGTWYHPHTPRKASEVVSSQAYKEGLVWKAMQAHAMGYSMLPFGHWEQEPPKLDAFLNFLPSRGTST